MPSQMLRELTKQNIDYALQKLTEAIEFKENLPLARAAFPTVRTRFEKEKQALQLKHGDLPQTVPGLYYTIDGIEYVIGRFESWLMRGDLYQNYDTAVFIDCLVYRIGKLKTILSE